MLRHFGLEPHRDVAIQPTSRGSTEQLAVLMQGLADAGILVPPTNLQAVKLGLVPVFQLADRNIPFMQGTIATTESYTREAPEVIRRALRALIAAVALARAEPDAAKGLLGKYTQTEDPEVLDDSYRYYRDLWGRPDFRVSPDAVRSILSVLDVPGAATAQPQDFIGNRFVDELHASGFIRHSGALD